MDFIFKLTPLRYNIFLQHHAILGGKMILKVLLKLIFRHLSNILIFLNTYFNIQTTIFIEYVLPYRYYLNAENAFLFFGALNNTHHAFEVKTKKNYLILIIR